MKRENTHSERIRTERERVERQTDRQTDRQTERERASEWDTCFVYAQNNFFTSKIIEEMLPLRPRVAARGLFGAETRGRRVGTQRPAGYRECDGNRDKGSVVVGVQLCMLVCPRVASLCACTGAASYTGTR